MGFYLTKLVPLFVLPPGGAFVLVLLGVLALRWRRRLAVGLMTTGVLVLFVASLPVVANALQRAVQIHPALVDSRAAAARAGAIVVLGGGRYFDAPEFGGTTVAVKTLARIRYGAKLHRETGLPLLVSGGLASEGNPSEAEVMARVLQEEFRVPVRWQEPDSLNTAENASFTARILNAEGIRRVILVTYASHMARSVRMFERYGLEVVPAPTLITADFDPRNLELRDFLPQAWALYDTRAVLHELLGMVWYELRYG